MAVRTVVRVIVVGALCLGGPGELQAQTEGAAHAAIHVNCDAGQSLGRALARAMPGQTVHAHGTCRGRVQMPAGVTLEGGNTAVLEGGGAPPLDPEFDAIVMVDGVTGVTLSGLTIQRGPGDGVLARHGASFAMRNVTVQDNAETGIAIGDNSIGEVIDSVTRRNRFGFDVFNSSTLVVSGTMSSVENNEGGNVFGSSILEVRGARMTVSDNATGGVVVGDGSQIEVFAFRASAGGVLAADRNPAFGFLLLGGSSMGLYNSATISAEGNGAGLVLIDSHVTSPFGTATVMLQDNGLGMNVGSGASVNLTGGFTARRNGIGVLADAAVALALESTPANPITVAGNGLDVDLRFGTRSTLQGEGLTIGTISCEASVLSRGTRTCP